MNILALVSPGGHEGFFFLSSCPHIVLSRGAAGCGCCDTWQILCQADKDLHVDTNPDTPRLICRDNRLFARIFEVHLSIQILSKMMMGRVEATRDGKFQLSSCKIKVLVRVRGCMYDQYFIAFWSRLFPSFGGGLI